MNTSFTVRGILTQGWAAYARNWAFLTVASIIVLVISIAVDFVVDRSANFSSILYAVFLVVGLLVNLVVQIGLVRATLHLTDGKKTSFKELVSNGHYFLPYAVSSIMLAAILLVGFTLFIIPGVIAMLVFGYAPIIVLDEDKGPVDALKRSAHLTKGVRIKILGLYAVVLAAVILSVLAFGIFLVVTIPLSMMISAAALRALQERDRLAPVAVTPSVAEESVQKAEEPAKDPSDPSNGAYA